jgi:hypothetical protein
MEINMWVFLNMQPSSDSAYANETTIFNYNNHPRITHKNESENKRLKNRNIYTFYFSNAKSTDSTAKYDLNIPDQKWNLLTFNYFDSKVDLSNLAGLAGSDNHRPLQGQSGYSMNAGILVMPPSGKWNLKLLASRYIQLL